MLQTKNIPKVKMLNSAKFVKNFYHGILNNVTVYIIREKGFFDVKIFVCIFYDGVTPAQD